MMNELMLFTDGSADVGSGIGCGAILAFGNAGQSLESLEALVRVVDFEATSSTRLELQVLVHALGELEGFAGRIVVHTDSQNVVGLPARRARLEESGFRTKRDRLLRNHDLYREFYRCIDHLDCEFIKVQGHRAADQKDDRDRAFTLVDRASRRALRERMSRLGK